MKPPARCQWKFFRVPQVFIEDLRRVPESARLNAKHLRVLLVALAATNQTNKWDGWRLSELADLAGLSEERASQALVDLRRLGYIEIDMRRGPGRNRLARCRWRVPVDLAEMSGPHGGAGSLFDSRRDVGNRPTERRELSRDSDKVSGTLPASTSKRETCAVPLNPERKISKEEEDRRRVDKWRAEQRRRSNGDPDQQEAKRQLAALWRAEEKAKTRSQVGSEPDASNTAAPNQKVERHRDE